ARLVAKRIQRYETGEIVVTFDPNRCIHTGRCLQNLPGVFDVSRRRWIELEAAPPDAVADTVRKCPSGALRYERLDGGPAEEPDRPATVRPVRRGPLYVRGEIVLLDPSGNPLDAGPRATLCRCGASENKPFCDNSHRAVDFEG